MGKNQHVVPTKNGWGVRGEKNSKITASFNTQAEDKLLTYLEAMESELTRIAMYLK